VITSVGYQYTGGEHKLHSGITWKGWYPVVDFRLSYGGEPSIVTGDNEVEPSVIYPSLSTGTEVYLPLQFTSGAYSQYLRASFYHRYNNRYIYNEADEVFDYGQSFISWKLFFSNSRRSSYRDIFPVFAQALELNYTNAPFDSEIYGTIASLRASLYFPGVIRNHGLRVRLQAERQVPEEYIQYNRINFPRGYSEIISECLKTISTDYVFPIAYPDIAIGSIAYIKRIRGSLFYDRSQGRENRFLAARQYVAEKQTFSSLGGELLTDFNLLRMPFDITGGARVGYIPTEKRSFIEAVFSVDIYGFSLGEKRSGRIPWL
ncbi:MAG: hypothetical protein IH591_10105, partial [Bacteroidales bacterium]|nr:hypothetical protein [Bacteroidales bacterium]